MWMKDIFSRIKIRKEGLMVIDPVGSSVYLNHFMTAPASGASVDLVYVMVFPRLLDEQCTVLFSLTFHCG